MDVYCIDTSSLIEMKDRYPIDVFVDLLPKMESLIKEGRLIAPMEVKREIERGDDELKKWVTGKKRLFVKPDVKQIKKVKEILRDYPFLAKSEEVAASNADPWLIALAIVRDEEEHEKLFKHLKHKHVVVTEESPTNPQKIPAVCRNYNIECINLLEFFRRLGWKFRIHEEDKL